MAKSRLLRKFRISARLGLWCGAAGVVVGGVAALWLARDSVQLFHTQQELAAQFDRPLPATYSGAHLRSLAMDRFYTYEASIRDHFLDRGMVINRRQNGERIDHCDSLLFSSLRFVALSKLGKEQLALDAWRAIEQSGSIGAWQRHQHCSLYISRDMVLGLLAAIVQRPPGWRQHFLELLEYVQQNDGYLGNGPHYVSQLTPGVAELMRRIAVRIGLPINTLPHSVRRGFSTAEAALLDTRLGYRSHLIAMTIFIEMEIERNFPVAPEGRQEVRDVPAALDMALAAWWPLPLAQQRHLWVVDRLAKRDPPNLFYQYLRLRAAGVLTPYAREHLLATLLMMPAFPVERPPHNCDRRADYLWQRSSDQYLDNSHNNRCERYFSGVDYIWMVGLLLEEDVGDEAGALAH